MKRMTPQEFNKQSQARQEAWREMTYNHFMSRLEAAIQRQCPGATPTREDLIRDIEFRRDYFPSIPAFPKNYQIQGTPTPYLVWQ